MKIVLALLGIVLGLQCILAEEVKGENKILEKTVITISSAVQNRSESEIKQVKVTEDKKQQSINETIIKIEPLVNKTEINLLNNKTINVETNNTILISESPIKIEEDKINIVNNKSDLVQLQISINKNATKLKITENANKKLIDEMQDLEKHDLEFKKISQKLQQISKSPQFQGHLKLLQHFEHQLKRDQIMNQNGFKAFKDLKRRFSSPLTTSEKSEYLSQFGNGLDTMHRDIQTEMQAEHNLKSQLVSFYHESLENIGETSENSAELIQIKQLLLKNIMRAKKLGTINSAQTMIIQKLHNYVNNLQMDNQKILFEKEVKELETSLKNKKLHAMSTNRVETTLRKLSNLI